MCICDERENKKSLLNRNKEKNMVENDARMEEENDRERKNAEKSHKSNELSERACG